MIKFFSRFKKLFKNPFRRRRLNRLRLVQGLSLVIFLVFIVYVLIFSAPSDFSENTMVRIEAGSTLSEVAQDLADQAVIRRPVVFMVLSKLIGNQAGVIAGDYYFSRPPNVVTVANRLVKGKFDIDAIKVTFPEGLTVNDMAVLLDDKLPSFDRQRFVSLAEEKEGFLFPDTYFFSPFSSEADVIKEMRQNFDRQVSDLYPHIATTGRNLKEIVIMASILEKEARTTESRRIISGILWKRIDNDMRLQVDAVFPYIIGKNTFELTTDDLFHESPYNTYRHEGLPPGPIANPSRNAIEAALFAENSPFWFYLSDRSGEMHYAITHDDHVRNKNRYLR